MKRILHISKYYRPHIGGIEDVCYNIVNTLKEHTNISQLIFCFNDTNTSVNDIVGDVPVRRVAIQRVVARQPISWGYKEELKETIKSFSPTHIHFHTPNPLSSFCLLQLIPANVKLIVHWHSDIVAQKFIYNFFKPIETRLLKRAEKILATSPNYITDSLPLQRFKDKVEVFQNVIDPQRFELTDAVVAKVIELKNKYENKPIVFTLGRHVEYKGLKFLVESANQVKEDCIFLIGGNGPLTDELKAKARQNNKVHFVGRISDDELSSYFYACDIFAFPSITKNEAFGVALAEAMYCRTPAITFTIEGSGVNWVNLNGVTGIETENSNSEQLAHAIDILLSNEALRLKYASNARQRVENEMTKCAIESKLNSLYE